MERLLSPFQSLRHLVSIDGFVMGEDTWDCIALLGLLQRLRPSLQRLLVRSHNISYIWEMRGTSWVKRDVRQFSQWDIIRGACDDL